MVRETVSGVSGHPGLKVREVSCSRREGWGLGETGGVWRFNPGRQCLVGREKGKVGILIGGGYYCPSFPKDRIYPLGVYFIGLKLVKGFQTHRQGQSSWNNVLIRQGPQSVTKDIPRFLIYKVLKFGIPKRQHLRRKTKRWVILTKFLQESSTRHVFVGRLVSNCWG